MTDFAPIELTDLETTCGGKQDATELALSKLLEQTKDLARQPQKNNDVTNLMFVAVAARYLKR